MKPKITHSWSVDAKGNINCFKKANDQYITKLWEASELTHFHDADLAKATSEINEILNKVNERNKDRSRELAFISVYGGLFLAWTQYAVGPEDDFDTIVKALRIKAD